jgi:hypothetical protein
LCAEQILEILPFMSKMVLENDPGDGDRNFPFGRDNLEQRPPVPRPGTAEDEDDGDSDAEADDGQGGYSLLPQDGNDAFAPEEGDDYGAMELGPSAAAQEMMESVSATRRREEAEERARVWTGPSPQADAIQMDSAKADSIKTAMATFRLPEEAIPSWARDMGEDKWRDLIAEKIGGGPQAGSNKATL